MKKLKFWLAGALFAALAVAMAVNINLEYSTTTDSKDFILNNVEALAQGEGIDEECLGSGSIVCGGGLYKARISGR